MDDKYRLWVEEQARLLHSDGCTVVPDCRVGCCYEHDLAYQTGKDPLQAYRYGWDRSGPISRREADYRFWECNQAESAYGIYSPLAFWRWVAVRVFGGILWKH